MYSSSLIPPVQKITPSFFSCKGETRNEATSPVQSQQMQSTYMYTELYIKIIIFV